jgi:hypothetical protein
MLEEIRKTFGLILNRQYFSKIGVFLIVNYDDGTAECHGDLQTICCLLPLIS